MTWSGGAAAKSSCTTTSTTAVSETLHVCTHEETNKASKHLFAHQEEEASRAQATRGVFLRGVVNHSAVRPVPRDRLEAKAHVAGLLSSAEAQEGEKKTHERNRTEPKRNGRSAVV